MNKPLSWKRNEEIVWEGLDGEALLVEPRTAQAYVLNSTAAFIWRHCQRSSLSGLAKCLARVSGKTRAAVEGEIAACCRSLEAAGLLVAARGARISGAGVLEFRGLYSAPGWKTRSLGSGPRRRPSPRGTSIPG